MIHHQSQRMGHRMLQAFGIVATCMAVFASAERDSHDAQRQHTSEHHRPKHHPHHQHPSESERDEAALPWCDEVDLPGGSGDELQNDSDSWDDTDGLIEPKRWKRHNKKGPKKNRNRGPERGPEPEEDTVAFGPGDVPCRHRNETGFGPGEHRHHEAERTHNSHSDPHKRALIAVLIVVSVLVVLGLFVVCVLAWKKKKTQNSVDAAPAADGSSTRVAESKVCPLELVVTAEKISDLQSQQAEPVPPKYAVARHSNGTPEPTPEYSQATHTSATVPEYDQARSIDRSASNPVYTGAGSGDIPSTQA